MFLCNYSAWQPGVKIPAFILKITKELYRHSGMVLAGIQDGVYGYFLDPG